MHLFKVVLFNLCTSRGLKFTRACIYGVRVEQIGFFRRFLPYRFMINIFVEKFWLQKKIELRKSAEKIKESEFWIWLLKLKKGIHICGILDPLNNISLKQQKNLNGGKKMKLKKLTMNCRCFNQNEHNNHLRWERSVKTGLLSPVVIPQLITATR